MEDGRNLRMLRDTRHPLGVMCNFCLHRSLVDFGDLIEKHGLMRKLSDLRFRCSKCGRRDFIAETFARRGDVTRFMRRD